MNKMYQWLFFNLIKPLVKVPDKGQKIDRYYARMKWQIRVAGLLGGAHRFIVADSNGENENTYQTMKLFKKITINA